MTDDHLTPRGDGPDHASHADGYEHDVRFRLLEAQRITSVGSYIWDFVTGKICWSEECHRLFGVDRDTFTVTVDMAIDAIHLADQANAQAWVSAPMVRTGPFPIT